MKGLMLATPLLVWDFSAASHGVIPAGEAAQWEWGVPATGPGGGETVWGTNLAGLYLNDTVDTLEIPIPDLSGTTRPTLWFEHWYAIELGDSATVEIDDGGGWTRVEPIYGYPDVDGWVGASAALGGAGWVEASVDLSPFGPTPRVRLVFDADPTLADDGWYLAEVAVWDGDVTRPRIEPVAVPADSQDLAGPYLVTLQVSDDDAVAEVSVDWTGGGGGTVVMTDLGGGLYGASIPGRQPDTTVLWHATAVDASGNTARYPASGEAEFRVFLAAPTDLLVLSDSSSGRPVGDTVTVGWSAPDSPHDVLRYELQDVGGLLAPIEVPGDAAALEAEIALAPDDPQLWWVHAIYAAGRGDPSEPVSLDLEVPALESVSPEAVGQGQTRHVRIVGGSLYLLDGVSTLDLGEGVEVLELEVSDVSSLDALVEVSDDAEPGPRAVAITGSQGTFVFPDRFEVLDASAGLAVVGVEPSSALQGQAVEVEVRLSEVVAGPFDVTVPDDLVLRQAPVVDGDTVVLDLVVNNDARVGTQTLILDDGEHRLVAELEVKERVYQARTGCSTVGGSVGGPVGGPGGGPLGGTSSLIGLLAGLLARRRRGARR